MTYYCPPRHCNNGQSEIIAPPSGGIILDPFSGSGSTAVLCKESGVDFICVEKEDEYCEIAERRLIDS
ncbi:MAG: hypothetical protein HY913_04280 [Desulfomonile tiedjei]|nr:hypothetical protein [Desulfomonile tiedjei]